ncbi:MAG: hypothetical protein HY908_19385 [Myxococcales bacterium]|nr:hypothetical protein [Myxococcales bacterium]
MPALPPPNELPYDDSQPIPPGYRLDSHPRVGLIIGGSVTFGVLYLSSALAASLILDTSGGEGERGAPLYAPAIGPFIAMGTLKTSATGKFGLVIDGLGQVAGVAMFVAGFAAPSQKLVRNEYFTADILPTSLGEGAPGLGMVGEF